MIMPSLIVIAYLLLFISGCTVAKAPAPEICGAESATIELAVRLSCR